MSESPLVFGPSLHTYSLSLTLSFSTHGPRQPFSAREAFGGGGGGPIGSATRRITAGGRGAGGGTAVSLGAPFCPSHLTLGNVRRPGGGWERGAVASPSPPPPCCCGYFCPSIPPRPPQSKAEEGVRGYARGYGICELCGNVAAWDGTLQLSAFLCTNTLRLSCADTRPANIG